MLLNSTPLLQQQAHKIPGTRPAPPLDIHLPPPNSLAHSEGAWEGEGSEWGEGGEWGEGENGGSAAFKAKMESLADGSSTNLYMEGFETRAGAEEIIERLHGRMVRGWNDAGSRISVRFADTAEQRELRRNERMAREGEESPARLTIAQAALLNLHGSDLRSAPDVNINANKQTLQLPVPVGRIPTPRQLFSHQHQHQNGYPQNIHRGNTHTPPFVVDYSLAPSRAPHGHGHVQRGPSPYYGQGQEQGGAAGMDPAMAALLESLHHGHGHGREFASNRHLEYESYEPEYSDYGAGGGEYGYVEGRPRSRGHAQGHGVYRTGSGGSGGAAGATSVRGGGYTATEEFIMRAHADAAQQQQSLHNYPNSNQSQPQAQHQHIPPQPQSHQIPTQNANQNQNQIRRRPAPPPLDLAAHNMRRRRDSNAAAAGGGPGFSPALGAVPLVGEDEFHNHALAQNVGGAVKHNHRIHPAHVNARLGRAEGSPALESGGQSQGQNGTQNQQNQTQQHQNYQPAHLRSSTLPHRAAPAAAHASRHYQHSSMSIPASNGIGIGNNNNNSNSGYRNGNTNTHMDSNSQNQNQNQNQAQTLYDSDAVGGSQFEEVKRYHHPNHQQHQNQHHGRTHSHSQSQAKAHHHPSHAPHNHNHNHGAYLDSPTDSPSLVSPALTYSRDTPSTLSPATPFFNGLEPAGAQMQGMEGGKGMKMGQGIGERERTQGHAQQGLRVGSQ
ncbi:hypothetical protein DXG01_011495 [Tephrocybe rancida]|nr:hypothetical protein DXG01_011495 [Tephrocybe rancida]